MDGRNADGRVISLLNSEGPAYNTTAKAGRSCYSSRTSSSNTLPSFASYSRSLDTHSRTSSYASSPASSPQTPPLSRSGSSDSVNSRIMQIPSPITPDFQFDAPFPLVGQQPSPDIAKQSFFPALPKDQSMGAFGPLPTNMGGAPFAYPVPQLSAVSAQPSFMPATVPAPQPSSPVKAAEPKGGSSSKAQSKKNQYPCPMAKQFSCNDYFTTSGHAARHAKKHTGRKDAICPECNKAFTRKDNMEQHRRTHQNGRSTQKSGEDSSSSSSRKSKSLQPPAAKRPRPSPLQPTAAELASAAQEMPLLDPMLPTSPDSTLAFTDPSLVNGAFQPLAALTTPYLDPEPYHYDPQLTNSFTAGLDTLAIVATDAERKRKFED